MKEFLKRLETSKVVWKQCALTIITTVLGGLLAFGVIDPATYELWLELATYIVVGLLAIATAIYSVYSAGNNPTNLDGY